MAIDPTSIYGGYIRASRYSRIKDPDIERALKPYKIKLGDIRRKKGATDAALRHVATKAVVTKYLKGKKSVNVANAIIGVHGGGALAGTGMVQAPKKKR